MKTKDRLLLEQAYYRVYNKRFLKRNANGTFCIVEKQINPNLAGDNYLSTFKKEPEKAKQVITGGTPEQDKSDPSDDAIPVNDKFSAPANTLKAGQSNMDFDKFITQAIQMFGKIPPFDGPGGDLGAIVSQDNFMMDGHHRWVATMLVDPNANLGGTQVQLPYQTLLGVLNAWTVANNKKPKEATTPFAEITGEKVKNKILELCQSGWGGKFTITPETIKNAFDKQGLTFEKAAEMAKTNWDQNTKIWGAASGKPSKVEMPVIEDEQAQAAPAVKDVADKLTQGEVDVYSQQQAAQPQAAPQQQAAQPQRTAQPQQVAK